MMGPLQIIAVPYFDTTLRSRGVKYQQQGRIKIVQSSPLLIRAEVRGTSTYEVILSCEKGGDGHDVVMTCSCPFFRDHDACKHGWAVLCEADRLSLMKPPRGARFMPLSGDYREDREVARLEENEPKVLVTPSKSPRVPAPEWKRALNQMSDPGVEMLTSEDSDADSVRESRITYWLSLHDAVDDALMIGADIQTKRTNNEWGKVKPLRSSDVPVGLPEEDMAMAALIITMSKRRQSFYAFEGLYELDSLAAQRVLPSLCSRENFFAANDQERWGPLRWDADTLWQVELELISDDTSSDYQMIGWMQRGEERRPLSDILRVMQDRWIVWPDAIGRCEGAGSREWLVMLQKKKSLRVKADEAEDFLTAIMKRPNLPRLRLPPSLRYDEIRGTPKPHLNIYKARSSQPKMIPASIEFQYDETIIRALPERAQISFPGRRCILHRDLSEERSLIARTLAMGVKRQHSYVEEDPQYAVPATHLPELVRSLLAEGWTVLAENRPFRMNSSFSISVASGIDWFDMTVNCDFGGISASLPALLAAARERQEWVQLSDGTWGMVPEQWIQKYAGIVSLGESENGAIRFKKNQAALLDAWLAAQPGVMVDEMFKRTRERIASFSRIEAVEAPPGFCGSLRPYQNEGLGWLRFLQQMEFGGCLADDMGLGKTVQVLALLEERRERRSKEKLPPSLVVMPRSLLFNWMQEAGKFAPHLRVVDFTGSNRALEDTWQTSVDVVLTTYGTLRRDIEMLKEHEFDYVILDESQAVKNAMAQTAKSVRLLRCKHRLAMSGTPVENHLGELWSLFEFLNPGLLGASSAFSQSMTRDPTPEQRSLLARALRPFLLRRTKGQVAKDLPDRQEDTLYCELPPAQRKQYDELREYYRKALMDKVATDGLNKSKIVVLEALLRLRQAACHPALIDKKSDQTTCAKFDTLLPQLAEVVEEGHKALVFSQFTGFLSLLRKQLDAQGIVYEYLDGKTKDRQARVERFQTDPTCKLFLISLKAGGVGLNLTAAEYVFLLDPWWNPAVEAQAIDRAHRIGQTQKVMAYRLIAKDTVEEKVLALQQSKRELANAILSEDNAVLRNLTRDDLEFLLG
jgi:superfamily II DNA or RNA helicase